MDAMTKRKTVGLALGSGGTRGCAHVGVIKALVENNIPIDYISGCSIGAWVAACYGLYRNVNVLAEYTVGSRWEKFYSFLEAGRSGGIIKGDRMEKLLDEWLQHKTFEDLKIPVKMISVDLVKGERVILDSGPLGSAVRRSMSIPALFKPVQDGERILVDGGVADPVPDGIVRDMGADVVVAVNLDDFQKATWFNKESLSIKSIVARTAEISRHHLAEYSLTDADVVIRPPVMKYTQWREYFWREQGSNIEKAGYDATLDKILEIKTLIAQSS